MPELSLLTLNIANPSPERVERQLGWLAARDEDVLVLTETKDRAGSRQPAARRRLQYGRVPRQLPEAGKRRLRRHDHQPGPGSHRRLR
jgi:exodeoxyribonuclease-3